MNGFVNVYKPKGMTSAFCVWLVKRVFNCPCGHMGTLDPMASGVLPVGVGKASRLFDYLLDKEKTYVAEFTFGKASDTLDTTGRIIAEGGRTPRLEEIRAVLGRFVGEIEQVPPKFSAKCIDGKRCYDLARKGKDFDLAPRKVTIYSLEAENGSDKNTFRFTVKCKGGTYIRSLCRDIAAALGTIAVMSGLERTAAGVFRKENSVNADDLAKFRPEELLLPSDIVVDFAKLTLSHLQAQRLINGLYDDYAVADGLYRVYDEGEFWGVGKVSGGKMKMRSYVRG